MITRKMVRLCHLLPTVASVIDRHTLIIPYIAVFLDSLSTLYFYLQFCLYLSWTWISSFPQKHQLWPELYPPQRLLCRIINTNLPTSLLPLSLITNMSHPESCQAVLLKHGKWTIAIKRRWHSLVKSWLVWASLGGRSLFTFPANLFDAINNARFLSTKRSTFDSCLVECWLIVLKAAPCESMLPLSLTMHKRSAWVALSTWRC